MLYPLRESYSLIRNLPSSIQRVSRKQEATYPVFRNRTGRTGCIPWSEGKQGGELGSNLTKAHLNLFMLASRQLVFAEETVYHRTPVFSGSPVIKAICLKPFFGTRTV